MNLTKKLSYSEAMDFIERNKAAVKLFYITKNLTARITAEKLNVHYDANWQKALLRTFGEKGAGLGGARQGAGNKKGIKFCENCRKSIENCTCNDV